MKVLSEATDRLFRPIEFSTHDRLHVSLNAEGDRFICSFYQEVTDRRGYPSYNVRRYFVARFPERRQLDGLCVWELAATDTTANLIDKVWPASQLIMDDDAKVIYQYCLATTERQDQVAEAVAHYKADKTLPSQQFDLHCTNKLASYQQVGLYCSVQSEGYGLFMEQGTGKTAVVIARICNEAKALGQQIPAEILVKAENTIRQAQTAIRKNREELLENAKTRAQRFRARLMKIVEERARRRLVEIHFVGVAAEMIKRAQDTLDNVNRQATYERARAETKALQFKALSNKKAEADADDFATVTMNEAKAQAAALIAKSRVKAKKPRMYRAIIVCPNNVRQNWYREFEKFATEPGQVTVLRGGQVERAKLLVEAFTPDGDSKYTVIITSYETLIRSWNAIRMVEWDLSVLDESHYIKSQGSKRYKFALQLRDRSKRRMVLTGTPITNTPLDLFTQFEFMGKGFSGFRTWNAFRQFYGVYNTSAQGHQALVGMQNLPFMQERLARLSFIIHKTEALPDLPDKVYDISEVEMTAEQAEYYNQLARTLALEIERDLESGGPKQLVVNNILTKLLRLAQITSGFITWDATYDEDGNVVSARQIDRLDPNPKLEALVELLKEKGPNDKTLVWACWVQDIRSIAARLALEGIDAVTFYGGTSEADRQEAERRFNEDPNCRVFIGNPAAGGVGLNLLGYPPNGDGSHATNCNHVIYFSQNWSPTARSQSEDRAHRRGTRENVRITDLCVPNTIDEDIRERVLQKRTRALEIADIRATLNNVLRGYNG